MTAPATPFPDLLASLLHAAAAARLALIAELSALLTNADDPVEKRRVASTLLRATQAPLLPIHRDPDSGACSLITRPLRDHPDDRDLRIPRPTRTPTTNLSPADVAYAVAHALQRRDHPADDAGIATLAAFLDDNAHVDHEPLPAFTDTHAAADPADARDAFDVLADAFDDSSLAVIQKADFVQSTLTTFSNPDAADVHMLFFRDAIRIAYFVISLRRRRDSHAPGCFLITAFTSARQSDPDDLPTPTPAQPSLVPPGPNAPRAPPSYHSP